MKAFLRQVANHYIKVQGLEDYCFIFPNRRSGQFFTHYLQQDMVAADQRDGVLTPHLMPRVTSINDLVAELTGTVAATDIEMMFALYDAYCQAMGDRAQEFDKFIYWAQLIISDFNDIDRSMADVHEIYQNLGDLHDLSSNYLSEEVKEKVRKIFGGDLFTAFFDTDADASLWRLFKDEKEGNGSGGDDVVKREFLTLWNALETIFNNYHKTLATKGVTTPGRQLRMAAEIKKDNLPYTRMVFVGFGVLSAAEVKLFDHFKLENKADFWWDNAGIPAMLEKAPHDPGALLIDGYCKRFKSMPIQPLEANDQTIKVVAVPSNVGQAKQAFNEVAIMRKAGGYNPSSGLETAIVLPDEGLLVPLLHSVHGVSRLNVTLGYPLRSSGIVSLMHIVARMHHQASKERDERTSNNHQAGKERVVLTYYREDINDILSHPLIKTYFTAEALSMVAKLARMNRFRVPAHEFEELSFRDLFKPAMDTEQGDERVLQSSYIDNLLNFCNLLMDKMNVASVAAADDEEDDQSGVEVTLQQAFLIMYIDVLNQLKRSLAECGQTVQRSTLFYLIDRLTASAIVPFTGEPLQGVQVMGLLETRSLDFENVVILSMNERVFPRRRSINSFIPNYIRRAHGMSTIEQQEAIISYNFYRLLNRSRHVTLIYDSSAQKLGSSEPSRYIDQLEKVYGKCLHYVEMTPEVETTSAISIKVPAVAGDLLRDRYTRDPEQGGKYLSASAINKYINCPLLFYLHYIQGLNDDNETSDFMDNGTFGTIIHDTLGDCYYSQQVREKGGLVDKAYLEFFKKNKLRNAVVRNIKKTYLRVPEDQLDTDTRPLRGESFMLIDTIESYVRFVLDHDIELLGSDGTFTILECEETHNMPSLEMGGERFNFTYKPDRIDRLNDGTVRIVDYKTGKDETTFVYHQPGLQDLFERNMDKRRKAILQLFLYSYAYMEEHPEEPSVMPVIYKLSSMQDSGVFWKENKRGAKPNQYVFEREDPIAKEFITQMGGVIKSLYEDGFEQVPEDPKSRCCNYCRFIDFCRRQQSQTY